MDTTLDRPTRDDLIAAATPEDLSARSFLDFCVVPPGVLGEMQRLAVPEDWGVQGFVLLKYLAVHVPLAIEQGRYVWNGKAMVMRAGRLCTSKGAAVYLGLARRDGDSWTLVWAGERPSNVEHLLPAKLDNWPEIDPRLEVVVVVDQFRAAPLAGLSLVTQHAAVAGAVAWSLRRGLAVRQVRGYYAPVHLTNRDGAPDLVAAIQVQPDRIIVRALLDPRDAYANVRAVVERCEEIPDWVSLGTTD